MSEQIAFEMTPQLLIIVSATAAIVQMIKKLPLVQGYKAWLPCASLAIALGLCFLQGVENPILPSIFVGLAASGGYDLMKNSKKQ